MRLTFNPIRDGVRTLSEVSNQFAEAQWQVASGLRVRVPSDDPAAAQGSINDQAEIDGIDAYQRSSDTATSRLSVLDSVLGDIVDRLTQAMTLAQGARGSTADATTRATAAQGLGGVRDAIAADINTTFHGTYLFSGSQATTPAYALVAGAWTYQGDATPVTAKVDATRSVTIAMDGDAVLKGSDATDVLNAIDTLVAAVQAGDNAAIGNGIDALQRAFSRTVRAQSQVGTDEASVASVQQALTMRRTGAEARLSAERDANLADAITKMNQAQTAYKAALGAVSTADRLSLLDYLR